MIFRQISMVDSFYLMTARSTEMTVVEGNTFHIESLMHNKYQQMTMLVAHETDDACPPSVREVASADKTVG